MKMYRVVPQTKRELWVLFVDNAHTLILKAYLEHYITMTMKKNNIKLKQLSYRCK